LILSKIKILERTIIPKYLWRHKFQHNHI